MLQYNNSYVDDFIRRTDRPLKMIFKDENSGLVTLSAHCVTLRANVDHKKLEHLLRTQPDITIGALCKLIPSFKECWAQANSLVVHNKKSDSFVISNGYDGFCVLIFSHTQGRDPCVTCTLDELSDAPALLRKTLTAFYKMAELPSCIDYEAWNSTPTFLREHPITRLWPLLCTHESQPFASRECDSTKTNAKIIAFWKSVCSAGRPKEKKSNKKLF